MASASKEYLSIHNNTHEWRVKACVAQASAPQATFVKDVFDEKTSSSHTRHEQARLPRNFFGNARNLSRKTKPCVLQKILLHVDILNKCI